MNKKIYDKPTVKVIKVGIRVMLETSTTSVPGGGHTTDPNAPVYSRGANNWFFDDDACGDE